jgi:type I restriction enzyme, S subunit
MPDVATPLAGWSSVAFGDVVGQIKDKVDPQESGLKRYIAGEHMDTNDLCIRRWGEICEDYLGPAFHMRFKPGHVLYGSRRTYLRKVALADFEGITANTTYVLESKNPGVLLPELLPFIMCSEPFHAHSKRESKGSVNPYVNFSDLEWYEFALPPLEEQHKIVEVLQAAKAQTEQLYNAFKSAGRLSTSIAVNLFAPSRGTGIKPSEWKPVTWKIVSLEQLVSPEAPICYGIVQVGKDDPKGVPTLAINNIGGNYQDGIHRTAQSIESNYRRSRVVPGDTLMSIKGTIGEIANVPPHFEGNISRDLARLRLDNSKIRRRFFYHLFKSPHFSRYISSLVVGSTRAELSIALIRTMEIPLPPPKLQDDIVARFDSIHQGCVALEERHRSACNLLSSCLNQLLSHGAPK